MFKFLAGVIFAMAAIAGAIVAGVMVGALPAGADQPYFPFERFAAHKALDASVDHGTQGLKAPDPTDADVVAGIKLYGANCAVCHGASDGKASNMARGFYVRAPQFAEHGVTDDPEEESFWKIAHGIRFTAMPGFGKTLTESQMWQIAAFVARMDKLSPAATTEWKNLPSVADPNAPAPAPGGGGP